MRRDRSGISQSCMSPLIESLFCNRRFPVAGFSFFFTIPIQVNNIFASPFLYQSLVLMAQVSLFKSEVSLPVSLVGKGVSEHGCVC